MTTAVPESGSDADADCELGEIVHLLVRAAREFRRGGWVFTGFNWPVLAGYLAWSLEGRPFAQVFEGGAICSGRPQALPTSTTDYDAYLGTLRYRCPSIDVLGPMVRHVDTAVLDAANLDVRGRTNSSLVGDRRRPTVRLPGGGGAPDVMARARRIVLIYAGASPQRLTRSVEHVTAKPSEGADVTLICRWGVLQLGQHPTVLETVPGARSELFLAHVQELGVALGDPLPASPPTPSEWRAAHDVLTEAAGRGYASARRIADARA